MIYHLDNPMDWQLASGNELIAVPTKTDPYYAQKHLLEFLAHAIVHGDVAHISGPTGGGKSTVINSLCIEKNWRALCKNMGIEYKPLKIIKVDLKDSEQTNTRRALKDGTTFDEKVPFRTAWEEAIAIRKTHYVVIHLSEMWRFSHTASMENGIINYLQPEIYIEGEYLGTSEGIAVVMDSNIQANKGEYTSLNEPDLALLSRITCSITLDYLASDLELEILKTMAPDCLEEKQLRKLVVFVEKLREAKEDGLRTVPAPTFRQLKSLLKRSGNQKDFDLNAAIPQCFYGTASTEDYERADFIRKDVFSTYKQRRRHEENVEFF